MTRLDVLLGNRSPTRETRVSRLRGREGRSLARHIAFEKRWLDEHHSEVREALSARVAQTYRVLAETTPPARLNDLVCDPADDTPVGWAADVHHDLLHGSVTTATWGNASMLVRQLNSARAATTLHPTHDLPRAVRRVEQLRAGCERSRQTGR